MAFPAIADQFPTCSLNCLSSSLVSRPDIVQDFKLLCVNVSIEKALAACVRTACSYADQQRVAGINSNLCTHEPVQTKAPLAVVIFSILGFLTQGIIGLRIYSRTKLGLALGLGVDDYLIMMASVILFFVQVLGIVVIFVLGFGRHTFNVNPDNIPRGLLLYYLDEILYQVLMPLVKVSILFFYLRLFPDPGFRKACYAMGVFAMLTSLIFMFITIFKCTPIRAAFDKSIKAHCIDDNSATFASSGVSIVTDFTILFMPIPRLIKLKVPRSKRNSVLILFSFGFLASIISIVRLPFIVQFGKTDDPFYDNIGPGIWTFAEMTSAVIAACLPALKPLLQHWFPRLISLLSPPALSDSPVPWSENDLGPRIPHVKVGQSPISRAFNSLFSRGDDEGDRLGKQRKFYEVREGRIVQLRSRFSQISLGGFEGGGKEDDLQVLRVGMVQEVEQVGREEMGRRDWEEGDWRDMLRENRWPLKPPETYDHGLHRSVDAAWV